MDGDPSPQEYSWDARTLRPRILLNVAVVFIIFTAIAFIGFDSVEAVKALLVTGFGSFVALIPTVLKRMEYRLDETGLEKRPVQKEQYKEFKVVFSWDELSHLIPTDSGFRFYKKVPEEGRVRRFLKTHFFDDYSGEFHVEPEDRDRVRSILGRHGLPNSKTSEGPKRLQHPEDHG